MAGIRGGRQIALGWRRGETMNRDALDIGRDRWSCEWPVDGSGVAAHAAAVPGGSGGQPPAWRRKYALAVAGSDLLAVAISSALYALWGTASPETVLEIGL